MLNQEDLAEGALSQVAQQLIVLNDLLLGIGHTGSDLRVEVEVRDALRSSQLSLHCRSFYALVPIFGHLPLLARLMKAPFSFGGFHRQLSARLYLWRAVFDSWRKNLQPLRGFYLLRFSYFPQSESVGGI